MTEYDFSGYWGPLDPIWTRPIGPDARLENHPVTPQRITQLRAMPYEEYLLTPEWRRTRADALRAAGWACRRCGDDRELQVHHRTYERLGVELSGDLEVLCRRCHRDEHGVQEP